MTSQQYEYDFKVEYSHGGMSMERAIAKDCLAAMQLVLKAIAHRPSSRYVITSIVLISTVQLKDE